MEADVSVSLLQVYFSLPLLPFACTVIARKKEGFFHSLFFFMFSIRLLFLCLLFSIGDESLETGESQSRPDLVVQFAYE